MPARSTDAAPSRGPRLILSAVLLVSISSLACKQKRGPPHALPSKVDLRAMQAHYGEALYSQDDEETLIRAFFADRRDGFFLDVGAGDPIRDSTTYYLERHLDWHGIAVDAIADYAPAYAQQRPATRFFSYFAGRKSKLTHPFFISDNKNLSSGSGDDPRAGDYRRTTVPTLALRDLLEREKVETIDLLSMDIEGAEPDALAGLDLSRFAPELACVEVGSPAVGLAVAEQFAVAGCAEIAAYRAIDAINRYYTCR